mmetsp:Transcript_4020/g.4643  ORF Transcript_4020/g.4643 Transcript_4020/m.4643 type:complete len:198 (+) Transcript_4020:97-690(+)
MKNSEASKAAFKNVVKVLESLQQDELFQMDLKDRDCLEAIRHWTQEERASAEVIEKKFNQSYRIQNVYSKLKMVQAACREVPMGVPINAILAGSTNPYYGVESTSKTEKGEADKSRTNKGEEAKLAGKDRTIPEKTDTKIEKPEASSIKPRRESGTQNPDDVRKVQELEWLSLSFQNVSIWWSIQILIIALYMFYYL